MTNVSCKEREARSARVHEPARFNQTFYPYACVLFSAACAVHQGWIACGTAACRHAVSGGAGAPA
ncbi:hypothetical protein XspCFBP7912_02885 [Xanthomonas sp. CFBP 7912]|nr:hypothetical protein XspCFBP7912_02885 [Xanthomonas sp. CFBP 7912]RJS02004.1 hypothetical protein XnspCFBP7698_18535 [Xanthomonas sp. CFBP 7698]